MNTREAKIKFRKAKAKAIGVTLGPISWPESDERIALRKLREKMVDLNVETENEMCNQADDIASILAGIQEGLASGIEDLNEAMGLDAMGNDKPE